MVNSLQKSYIKVLLVAVGSLVFAFFIISFLGTLFLSLKKHDTERRIAGVFNQKVTIERISYSFPNTVVLRNVAFYSDLTAAAAEIFLVKQIRVSLAVFNSVKKGKFIAARVILEGGRFQVDKTLQFIKEHRQAIIEFIKSLPLDQTFYAAIKRAPLIFRGDTEQNHLVAFDSFLNMKNRRFLLQGAVYFAQTFFASGSSEPQASKPPPWNYSFTGIFSEESFTLENALLDYGDFHLKLWGLFAQHTLSLSGFSQAHNFLYYDVNQPQKKQPKHSFWQKKEADWSKRPDGLFDPSVSYISDIDCVIGFEPNRVNIERIGFSIDNIPFLIKGGIAFEGEPKLDLQITSFPGEGFTAGKFNPKKFDMHIKGVLLAGSFSGTVDANFFRKTKHAYKQEELKVSIDTLKGKREKGHYLKVNVNSGQVFYASGKNKYDISFDKFQAFIDMTVSRIRSFQFSSYLYDGFITGQGTVDIAFIPPRSGIDFVIIDVSPRYFDSIIPFFSKVSGKLHCQGYYRNDPGLKVTGSAIVEEGELSDFQFFIWLANFFKIPSLRVIDFHSMSADFVMTEDITQMENIDINSDSLKAGGYFHLSYTNFVSGQLSLKIPRGVLVASPRFNTLMRMLGPDFDELGFEFQLSGLFDEMNFRWLDSRFKKSLQDSIPDFIERGIERKVEQIISQFYK